MESRKGHEGIGLPVSHISPLLNQGMWESRHMVHKRRPLLTGDLRVYKASEAEMQTAIFLVSICRLCRCTYLTMVQRSGVLHPS